MHSSRNYHLSYQLGMLIFVTSFKEAGTAALRSLKNIAVS